jgi:hypothetical protein
MLWSRGLCIKVPAFNTAAPPLDPEGPPP